MILRTVIGSEASNQWRHRFLPGAACLFCILAPAAQADEVATYYFNNNLNAQESGAPALTAVDPDNASGFTTADVFGTNQTVYHFGGTTDPANQGGLTLNTSGLVSSDDYSVQMVFELDDRSGGYRDVLGSQNRQSDDDLYFNPDNKLAVYPYQEGTTTLSSGTFYNVVLTVDPSGTVDGYVDGNLEFSVSTTVMNITSGNVLDFFLDNTAGGGQGEWSQGDVAKIAVFNTALTADQVSALGTSQPVTTSSTPEPGTMGLMVLGGLAFAAPKLKRRFSR